MKISPELLRFLKGTDARTGTAKQQPDSVFTSTATPKGLENYNKQPVIVQSGSGRRGEMVDQQVLDIQETEAFKHLPAHEQRRLLKTLVATSVRSDTRAKAPPTDADLQVLAEKQQAVLRTRNQIGKSGLQKLIERIGRL